MNVLNSLLGAGILSVPQSMTYCGVVPSVIILIIVGILSHIGTVLTMKLAARKGATDLGDLTEIILGKAGSIAIGISSLLFCVSCMVGYLVICSNMINSWFDAGGIDISDALWKRFLCLVIYGCAFPMAFTLPRSIGFLGPFSMATFGCICFFIVSMIVKGIILIPKTDFEAVNVVVAKFDMGVFSAISIYGLAFALPVVILPIVKPYNPDQRKRSVISAVSVILCFLAVVIPGILGYLIFGKDTAGIILDNFESTDVLMILVRIGFFVVVSFSYPCIGQSVMGTWSQWIFGDVNQGALPTKKRIVVLALTNLIPLAIAIFLPNARPALSIGGAFGGCLVDFFFPALMWVVISKKKWFHWQNILCIIFAIFGLVCCVIATYQAIVDAINEYKKI